MLFTKNYIKATTGLQNIFIKKEAQNWASFFVEPMGRIELPSLHYEWRAKPLSYIGTFFYLIIYRKFRLILTLSSIKLLKYRLTISELPWTTCYIDIMILHSCFLKLCNKVSFCVMIREDILTKMITWLFFIAHKCILLINLWL